MLVKLKFSWQIFEKSSNVKFHENPSSGNRALPCGRTDGRTDRHEEASSLFPQFCQKHLKTKHITCQEPCFALGDWSYISFIWLVRARSEPGGTREGKWRGNWRMEWVASTLTPPPNVVYPALLNLMRTPRLPAVDWTDAPTDLNGHVRFGERRNLVSARVPSRSARAILLYQLLLLSAMNKTDK